MTIWNLNKSFSDVNSDHQHRNFRNSRRSRKTEDFHVDVWTLHQQTPTNAGFNILGFTKPIPDDFSVSLLWNCWMILDDVKDQVRPWETCLGGSICRDFVCSSPLNFGIPQNSPSTKTAPITLKSDTCHPSRIQFLAGFSSLQADGRHQILDILLIFLGGWVWVRVAGCCLILFCFANFFASKWWFLASWCCQVDDWSILRIQYVLSLSIRCRWSCRHKSLVIQIVNSGNLT